MIDYVSGYFLFQVLVKLFSVQIPACSRKACNPWFLHKNNFTLSWVRGQKILPGKSSQAG
jgi:hypothetical protein